MSISFKAQATAQNFNNAFLSKTIDDIKTGKLTLRKFDGDATAIDDVQVFLNTLRADIDSNDVELSDHDTRISTNKTSVDDIITRLNAGEYIIRSYESDTEYQNQHGTPPYTDVTGVYHNTTTGLLRYYNDVDAEWLDVGKSSIGKHEILGTGNGVQTDFTLSTLPLTDESFIVYINGVKVKATDYSFNNPIISFNNAPVQGQEIEVFMMTEGKPTTETVVGDGVQVVGYVDVDASILGAKEFNLPNAPVTPQNVIIDIIGGSSQRYGTDFIITGNVLSWNGLRMEGSILLDTEIRYYYYL